MTESGRFEAASEAAERWPNSVAVVAHLAKIGNVDEAYRILLPSKGRRASTSLWTSVREHAGVLHELAPELAKVSDGAVKWERGRGLTGVFTDPGVLPHTWSSAHEAALGIAQTTLQLLADPLDGLEVTAQWAAGKRLLEDRAHAISMTSDEVSILQERFRRERAKFSPRAKTGILATTAEPPPAQRLRVDVEKGVIEFDGELYEDQQSTQALKWLKALVNQAGVFVSIRDIDFGNADRVDAVKPSVLKRYLPVVIRKLIECKRGRGCKIRL